MLLRTSIQSIPTCSVADLPGEYAGTVMFSDSCIVMLQDEVMLVDDRFQQ